VYVEILSKHGVCVLKARSHDGEEHREDDLNGE
jgi:hypothetical protein